MVEAQTDEEREQASQVLDFFICSAPFTFACSLVLSGALVTAVYIPNSDLVGINV